MEKKSLVVVLIALFLLVALVFVFFTESGQRLTGGSRLYPVSWTEAVELDSIDDIEKALQQPVELEDCPDCELVMVKDFDEVVVETCDDFLHYTQEDYYTASTYAIRMETTFVRQCKPFKYLQKAKDSTESYLASFDLRDDPVQLCLEIFGELEEGMLGPNCREMVVEEGVASTTQVNLIREGEGGGEDNLISRLVIKLLGQGDFDHDGVEDALIYTHYISYEGSWPGTNAVSVLKKDEEGTISIRN